MARSYSFFAQCFLFAFIMYISQLRLARDDIRTAGVHVRTLVAAVQVGMLALMLSMQAVLTFVVGIVKRDNLSFALLGRAPSSRRSVSSARSNRSARTFEEGLEDVDPDVEQLSGWGSALACGEAVGTDPHKKLSGEGKRRLDTVDEALERGEEGAGRGEERAGRGEEGAGRGEEGAGRGEEGAERAENGAWLRVESPTPSTPPSLLSGGHSGADGMENAIVFESNVKLDLYCLYIHSVGAVMYQTFLSFDYTLFNTQWMFAMGLLYGWVLVSLYKTLSKSESTPHLSGRLRSSLWVAVYGIIALSIQICALMQWAWPEDTSMGTLVNLYAPAFLAGCFWTSISSEMAFAGAKTSRGILFDSRRGLPTFLLVTAVGALYSSPESRLTVITYMRGLSRLATAHLLLLEPVLKFVSIYVLVIILERKKSTELVLSVCFVQGLFLILVSPAFDLAAITALAGCVVLVAVYTARLAA
jgi:hypothetical protein